jgi:hypothetical protein
METNRRRLLTGLAAGGVLAVALAGGGAAIAATGSASPGLAPAAALAATGTPGTTGTPALTAPNGQRAGARGAAFRFARRHPRVVRSAFRSAAAYLGLSPQQLRAQLREGKSLAQMAAARGKPVQGLENAILAGAVTVIDTHTGWTAARKAAVTARVKSHLNAIVNGTFPFGIGSRQAAPAAATAAL